MKIPLLIAALLVLAICTRPALHLWQVGRHDADARKHLAADEIDDASRLNATRVREVWRPPHPQEQIESWVAAALAHAAELEVPVAIGGARHSMGGHVMAIDALFLDMRHWRELRMLPDVDRQILSVQSGATWAEIIPYLDARGLSVGVMQSDNSFTVGGSISANCHGWQYGKPPIASTVRAFRLAMADGSIHRCSRDENAELFRLALGGYGIFGVILDVELEVVQNQRYRRCQYHLSGDAPWQTIRARIDEKPGAQMVYGRYCVTPDKLLDELLLTVYRPEDGTIPTLAEPRLSTLRRRIFRGSVGSDYGKRLRWRAENNWEPRLTSDVTSRNTLMNEPVTIFENRTADTTDILHEYFIPPDNLPNFVARAKNSLTKHNPELLNVTLRWVKTDVDSQLRYADQDMAALVMLFVRGFDPDEEMRMRLLTQDLIDAALVEGGRFYLPYRQDARDDQFRQAYPTAPAVFAAKRRYDPNGRFQSAFYRRWLPVAGKN